MRNPSGPVGLPAAFRRDRWESRRRSPPPLRNYFLMLESAVREGNQISYPLPVIAMRLWGDRLVTDEVLKTWLDRLFLSVNFLSVHAPNARVSEG